MSLDFFEGKRIAVTGGVGSVGTEIVRQLRSARPALVRVIDNNESALFEAEMRLDTGVPTEFYHADIADEHEMMRMLGGIDVCFHAAALKHVPSCERSPFSALHTNIAGTESVIRAALANDVERVLFTSTDKAVNPTNVMGTSKLLGERLFTAANALARRSGQRTIFSSTRFGNVALSRGSVIPVFAQQIAAGGPLTLTDRRMTRFQMDVADAVRLVIDSMAMAKGGEVFITKMPVIRIDDLAAVMVEHLGDVEIVEIGQRPGEKMWEELSTDEEARRMIEGDRYMAVLPALEPRAPGDWVYEGCPMAPSATVYHSEREIPMTRAEIAVFLRRVGMIA